MASKRIAIFQYDWPLQSYSRDLALVFLKRNYKVDFFGYNLAIGDFISESSMQQQNLKVLQFSDISEVYNTDKNVVGRLKKNLTFRKYKTQTNRLFDSDKIKIDRKVLLDAYKYLKMNTYDCFIGIEKQGLIWAGLLGEKLNVPFVYYSLELYIDGHPMLKHQKAYRPAEKYFHQKALGTIIQDEFRKNALYKANNVDNEAIYLPVSVPGPIVTKKSYFLHEKFNISKRKKIALFFGGMAPQRYCKEIVQAAQHLKEDIVVVFHGFEMIADYIASLKELNSKDKVIFSLEKLPEEELTDLISSADIGFAIYNNDNANDRFTAFSSQKIALFLKHGIPIISNHNESYNALFKEFKCGESIRENTTIEKAIVTIYDNLDHYRKSSFLAFDQYFNLNNLESKLMTKIDNLVK